jgi:Effector protein
MGRWSRRAYVEYVKKHAGRDSVDLQFPPGEPLDGDNPKILLSFFSMPYWMDAFDISFDDRETTFKRILGDYRSAANDHVTQVRAQARDINRLGPGTGQALFKELRVTGQWLRILPNWKWKDGPKASESPDDFIIGEPGGGDIRTFQRAAAKGAPVAGRRGMGVARDDWGRPIFGTGRGTNSVIWYTPGMFTEERRPSGPGWQPDEVLFHELVHATRDMRGVMNDMPVNKGYDNLEEYLAEVLTNIYLSDKGQTVFSGNHGGSVILRGADADNFLHNSQKVDVPPTMLIQNLKDYQLSFYQGLVGLPAWRPKYNWVKQYDQEWRALAARNHKG